MRSSTQLVRVVLGAVLCLAISWPASAAVGAYIKIVGAKQGQFKGEGVRQGSTQWIPVITVNYEMESPGAATGQAAGKRQHKPIRVTMERGAASLQLQKALQTNERLQEVVIEFVRSGAPGVARGGKEEVYQKLTLTDAAVVAIQVAHGSAAKTGHESEEISFTYEKMQVTHGQGNKTAADSWTAK